MSVIDFRAATADKKQAAFLQYFHGRYGDLVLFALEDEGLTEKQRRRYLAAMRTVMEIEVARGAAER